MKKFEKNMAHWKKWTVDAISLFFIILYTYAAVTKLIVFEIFQTQLEQFPFINDFSVSLAIILPTVQIITSFLYFKPNFRLQAFYSSLILLIIFNLYIIAVLLFAESIPCSCAGVVSTLSWNDHLIFNTGCSLLALLAIALSYDLKTYKSKSSTSAVKVNL